ncbi:hypothetical protein [Streptomyces anulatus]|uniref:hypothetical protein n=1 Tax=Streptomyces anulatus TaxID=1892 RepID=UPI0038673850
MEMMQGLLMPEGVIVVFLGVVGIGACEWRRVQLAREKRREREHELLAGIVADIADGEREVQVHHGGGTGAWSVSGTSPVERPGHGEVPIRKEETAAGRVRTFRRRQRLPVQSEPYPRK